MAKRKRTWLTARERAWLASHERKLLVAALEDVGVFLAERISMEAMREKLKQRLERNAIAKRERDIISANVARFVSTGDIKPADFRFIDCKPVSEVRRYIESIGLVIDETLGE